jgi:organic radical activating enzyme
MLLFEEPRFIELHKYSETCKRIIHGHEPVLIFGAGNAGHRALNALEKLNVPVAGIIDNHKTGAVNGIPVRPPEAYRACQQTVVAAIPDAHAAVLADLKENDIGNSVPYTVFLSAECMADGFELKYYLELSMQMERARERFDASLEIRQYGLGSVDFVITEKCSLRCRDCANLMQYFKAPRSADFHELAKAFEHLVESMGSIGTVHVLGGEPFIEPMFGDWIDYLLKFRIGSVVVHTNGTVMPDTAILDKLRDDRVRVNVSDYGLPSEKSKALENLLEQNGVRCFYFFCREWQDCAEIKFFGRSSSQLADQMRQCCVKDTFSIKDGKLWRCPFAGNAASAGLLPESEWEYVDLIDDGISKSERKERIAQFASLNSMKACNWCRGRPTTGGDRIPAAIQMKGVRSV